jgi:hypothetical protein
MNVFARLRPAILAALAWLSFLCACGNQGEGERCDTKNLSADCDDGLECRHVTIGAGYDVCCYPLGSMQISSPVCNQNPTASPTDAGSDAATEADGAAGASTETGAEAGSGAAD